MNARSDMIKEHGLPPIPVIVDRRKVDLGGHQTTKQECLKLDTFANLTATLMRLEDKIDDMNKVVNERIDKLSEGMNSMIRLEQQLLEQSKDIVSLEKTIEELKNQKNTLELRMTTLQNQFDAHRGTVSQYERAGWFVLSTVGAVVGAYLMKSWGLA